MANRLVEQYNVGDQVTISFQGDDRWWPGRVIRLDHPGVWVQTQGGQVWFVTNARRIRQLDEASGDTLNST